ncbi:MAG: hypothetical protein KDB11_31205, partial [Planctomycetales bacterium]|nr:hypothetical protein [Planctomycetales bacterium]
SSANHPTECDGYFGFAEVIFPVFLSKKRHSSTGLGLSHRQTIYRPPDANTLPHHATDYTSTSNRVSRAVIAWRDYV